MKFNGFGDQGQVRKIGYDHKSVRRLLKIHSARQPDKRPKVAGMRHLRLTGPAVAPGATTLPVIVPGLYGTRQT
jgi:hypothetical protein